MPGYTCVWVLCHLGHDSHERRSQNEVPDVISSCILKGSKGSDCGWKIFVSLRYRGSLFLQIRKRSPITSSKALVVQIYDITLHLGDAFIRFDLQVKRYVR